MLAAMKGVLDVWGQLVSAMHGKGWGGNGAEVYAYHLTPYSPMAHGGIDGEMAREAKASSVSPSISSPSIPAA